MELTNFENNKFKLTIICILLIAILKFVFSLNYKAIFSNIFVDAMFLLTIYFISTISKNKLFNNITYYLLFIPHFLVFSFNSIFLNDSLLMRYSLSNIDFGSILYLFKTIIPWKYFIILPLILIGLIYLSYKKIKYEKYVLYFTLILIFIGFIVLIFYPMTVSNIYLNTMHDQIKLSNYKTLDLNYTESNYLKNDFLLFDKELNEYNTYTLPNQKRILLFVLEQTSYNTFWKELENVSDERNFFLKTKENTHLFTNYYVNNQDSKTAIWTMFNSQFIPYESYIDDWNKKYGFILGKRNLIDLFNYHNYETHTACAISEPDLLLGIYNWDNITVISEKTNRSNFTCVHNLEYQDGCEDLILIDNVKEIIRNDKLFFLQEFIYGHGVEYQLEKKLTRTAYYNEYLFEIYEFLQQENLLNDTIIIVVADHGEKDYVDKELWNYKLPLFIISNDLKYKEINNLLFQIDFKDILLSYLNQSEIKTNNYGYIIGQTGNKEIAYLENNKYFLGKLYSNNIKLKEIYNIPDYEIINKLNFLENYKNYCENESLKENFHCEYCYENILKSKK